MKKWGEPACAVCNGALNLLSQVGAAPSWGCQDGERLPGFVNRLKTIDHHVHRRLAPNERLARAPEVNKAEEIWQARELSS